ncbi:hypothetical protein ACFLUV_05715 [Elusimicrobiota bacterium]
MNNVVRGFEDFIDKNRPPLMSFRQNELVNVANQAMTEASVVYGNQADPAEFEFFKEKYVFYKVMTRVHDIMEQTYYSRIKLLGSTVYTPIDESQFTVDQSFGLTAVGYDIKPGNDIIINLSNGKHVHLEGIPVPADVEAVKILEENIKDLIRPGLKSSEVVLITDSSQAGDRVRGVLYIPAEASIASNHNGMFVSVNHILQSRGMAPEETLDDKLPMTFYSMENFQTEQQLVKHMYATAEDMADLAYTISGDEGLKEDIIDLAKKHFGHAAPEEIVERKGIAKFSHAISRIWRPDRPIEEVMEEGRINQRMTKFFKGTVDLMSKARGKGGEPVIQHDNEYIKRQMSDIFDELREKSGETPEDRVRKLALAYNWGLKLIGESLTSPMQSTEGDIAEGFSRSMAAVADIEGFVYEQGQLTKSIIDSFEEFAEKHGFEISEDNIKKLKIASDGFSSDEVTSAADITPKIGEFIEVTEEVMRDEFKKALYKYDGNMAQDVFDEDNLENLGKSAFQRVLEKTRLQEGVGKLIDMEEAPADPSTLEGAKLIYRDFIEKLRNELAEADADITYNTLTGSETSLDGGAIGMLRGIENMPEEEKLSILMLAAQRKAGLTAAGRKGLHRKRIIKDILLRKITIPTIGRVLMRLIFGYVLGVIMYFVTLLPALIYKLGVSSAKLKKEEKPVIIPELKKLPKLEDPSESNKFTMVKVIVNKIQVDKEGTVIKYRMDKVLKAHPSIYQFNPQAQRWLLFCARVDGVIEAFAKGNWVFRGISFIFVRPVVWLYKLIDFDHVIMGLGLLLARPVSRLLDSIIPPLPEEKEDITEEIEQKEEELNKELLNKLAGVRESVLELIDTVFISNNKDLPSGNFGKIISLREILDQKNTEKSAKLVIVDTEKEIMPREGKIYLRKNDVTSFSEDELFQLLVLKALELQLIKMDLGDEELEISAKAEALLQYMTLVMQGKEEGTALASFDRVLKDKLLEGIEIASPDSVEIEKEKEITLLVQDVTAVKQIIKDTVIEALRERGFNVSTLNELRDALRNKGLKSVGTEEKPKTPVWLDKIAKALNLEDKKLPEMPSFFGREMKYPSIIKQALLSKNETLADRVAEVFAAGLPQVLLLPLEVHELIFNAVNGSVAKKKTKVKLEVDPAKLAKDKLIRKVQESILRIKEDGIDLKANIEGIQIIRGPPLENKAVESLTKKFITWTAEGVILIHRDYLNSNIDDIIDSGLEQEAYEYSKYKELLEKYDNNIPEDILSKKITIWHNDSYEVIINRLNSKIDLVQKTVATAEKTKKTLAKESKTYLYKINEIADIVAKTDKKIIVLNSIEAIDAKFRKFKSMDAKLTKLDNEFNNWKETVEINNNEILPGYLSKNVYAIIDVIFKTRKILKNAAAELKEQELTTIEHIKKARTIENLNELVNNMRLLEKEEPAEISPQYLKYIEDDLKLIPPQYTNTFRAIISGMIKNKKFRTLIGPRAPPPLKEFKQRFEVASHNLRSLINSKHVDKDKLIALIYHYRDIPGVISSLTRLKGKERTRDPEKVEINVAAMKGLAGEFTTALHLENELGLKIKLFSLGYEDTKRTIGEIDVFAADKEGRLYAVEAKNNSQQIKPGDANKQLLRYNKILSKLENPKPTEAWQKRIKQLIPELRNKKLKKPIGIIFCQTATVGNRYPNTAASGINRDVYFNKNPRYYKSTAGFTDISISKYSVYQKIFEKARRPESFEVDAVLTGRAKKEKHDISLWTEVLKKEYGFTQRELEETLDVMNDTYDLVRSKFLSMAYFRTKGRSTTKSIVESNVRIDWTLDYMDEVINGYWDYDDDTGKGEIKRVVINTHQVYFHPPDKTASSDAQYDSIVKEGEDRLAHFIDNLNGLYGKNGKVSRQIGEFDKAIVVIDTRGVKEFRQYVEKNKRKLNKNIEIHYTEDIEEDTSMAKYSRMSWLDLVKEMGRIEYFGEVIEGVLYSRYVGLKLELAAIKHFTDLGFKILQSGKNFYIDGKYVTELDLVVEDKEGKVFIVECKSSRPRLRTEDIIGDKIAPKIKTYKNNWPQLEKDVGKRIDGVIFYFDVGAQFNKPVKAMERINRLKGDLNSEVKKYMVSKGIPTMMAYFDEMENDKKLFQISLDDWYSEQVDPGIKIRETVDTYRRGNIIEIMGNIMQKAVERGLGTKELHMRLQQILDPIFFTSKAVLIEPVKGSNYRNMIEDAVKGLDIKGVEEIIVPEDLSKPVILKVTDNEDFKKLRIYIRISHNPEAIRSRDMYMLGAIVNGPPGGYFAPTGEFTLNLQQTSFQLGEQQLKTVLKHEFNGACALGKGKTTEEAHEYASKQDDEYEKQIVDDAISEITGEKGLNYIVNQIEELIEDGVDLMSLVNIVSDITLGLDEKVSYETKKQIYEKELDELLKPGAFANIMNNIIQDETYEKEKSIILFNTIIDIYSREELKELTEKRKKLITEYLLISMNPTGSQSRKELVEEILLNRVLNSNKGYIFGPALEALIEILAQADSMQSELFFNSLYPTLEKAAKLQQFGLKLLEMLVRAEHKQIELANIKDKDLFYSEVKDIIVMLARDVPKMRGILLGFLVSIDFKYKGESALIREMTERLRKDPLAFIGRIEKEEAGEIVQGDPEYKVKDEVKHWSQAESSVVEKIKDTIPLMTSGMLDLPKKLGRVNVLQALKKANIILVKPDEEAMKGFISHTDSLSNSIYIRKSLFMNLPPAGLALLLTRAAIKLAAKKSARRREINWNLLSTEIHRFAVVQTAHRPFREVGEKEIIQLFEQIRAEDWSFAIGEYKEEGQYSHDVGLERIEAIGYFTATIKSIKKGYKGTPVAIVEDISSQRWYSIEDRKRLNIRRGDKLPPYTNIKSLPVVLRNLIDSKIRILDGNTGRWVYPVWDGKKWILTEKVYAEKQRIKKQSRMNYVVGYINRTYGSSMPRLLKVTKSLMRIRPKTVLGHAKKLFNAGLPITATTTKYNPDTLINRFSDIASSGYRINVANLTRNSAFYIGDAEISEIETDETGAKEHQIASDFINRQEVSNIIRKIKIYYENGYYDSDINKDNVIVVTLTAAQKQVLVTEMVKQLGPDNVPYVFTLKQWNGRERPEGRIMFLSLVKNAGYPLQALADRTIRVRYHTENGGIDQESFKVPHVNSLKWSEEKGKAYMSVPVNLDEEKVIKPGRTKRKRKKDDEGVRSMYVDNFDLSTLEIWMDDIKEFVKVTVKTRVNEDIDLPELHGLAELLGKARKDKVEVMAMQDNNVLLAAKKKSEETMTHEERRIRDIERGIENIKGLRNKDEIIKLVLKNIDSIKTVKKLEKLIEGVEKIGPVSLNNIAEVMGLSNKLINNLFPLNKVEGIESNLKKVKTAIKELGGEPDLLNVDHINFDARSKKDSKELIDSFISKYGAIEVRTIDEKGWIVHVLVLPEPLEIGKDIYINSVKISDPSPEMAKPERTTLDYVSINYTGPEFEKIESQAGPDFMATMGIQIRNDKLVPDEIRVAALAVNSISLARDAKAEAIKLIADNYETIDTPDDLQGFLVDVKGIGKKSILKIAEALNLTGEPLGLKEIIFRRGNLSIHESESGILEVIKGLKGDYAQTAKKIIELAFDMGFKNVYINQGEGTFEVNSRGILDVSSGVINELALIAKVWPEISEIILKSMLIHEKGHLGGSMPYWKIKTTMDKKGIARAESYRWRESQAYINIASEMGVQGIASMLWYLLWDAYKIDSAEKVREYIQWERENWKKINEIEQLDISASEKTDRIIETGSYFAYFPALNVKALDKIETEMIEIVEGYNVRLENMSKQDLIDTRDFAADQGINRIKTGIWTSFGLFQPDVLTLSVNVRKKVNDLISRSDDPNMAGNLLRAVIASERTKKSDNKEHFNAYINELAPYMTEIEALALPLWFNKIFSGNINLKDIEIKEYLRREMGQKYLYDPRKADQIIDEAVRINSKFRGEMRIIDIPEAAGYVEPGEAAEQPFEKLKTGLKILLSIFSRFGRATIALPLAGLDKINPISSNRRWDGLMAAALGESGGIHIESIIERLMTILGKRRDEQIMPKLNKLMGVFVAT